jgi:hypothetical protein
MLGDHRDGYARGVARLQQIRGRYEVPSLGARLRSLLAAAAPAAENLALMPGNGAAASCAMMG